MRQVRRTIPEKDAKHRALLGLDSTEPVDRLAHVLCQCPCVLKIQVLTYLQAQTQRESTPPFWPFRRNVPDSLAIRISKHIACIYSLACALPAAWLCGCGDNGSVASSTLLPRVLLILVNISYVLCLTAGFAALRCPATFPTKLSC